MGYKEAMGKAGAEVLLYEEFGSCQGDWWAKIVYNGKEGWVNGSYGSCSGCDAFQAEFDYGRNRCPKHLYDTDEEIKGCEDCRKIIDSEDERLVEFGREYLENIWNGTWKHRQ